MTEEKADQICRCVKECWWRIAVLLLIPVVAAIALLSPWPWKESPWAALGVIATFSASVIALWLGVSQVKRLEKKKEHEGRIVAATTGPILEKSAAILYYCLNECDPEKAVSAGNKEQISSLWSIQSITLQHILIYSGLRAYEGSVMGENIGFVINTLELKRLPKVSTPDFCYQSFIRSMQQEPGVTRLRDVTMSLRAIAELMRKDSYKATN